MKHALETARTDSLGLAGPLVWANQRAGAHSTILPLSLGSPLPSLLLECVQMCVWIHICVCIQRAEVDVVSFLLHMSPAQARAHTVVG